MNFKVKSLLTIVFVLLMIMAGYTVCGLNVGEKTELIPSISTVEETTVRALTAVREVFDNSYTVEEKEVTTIEATPTEKLTETTTQIQTTTVIETTTVEETEPTTVNTTSPTVKVTLKTTEAIGGTQYDVPNVPRDFKSWTNYLSCVNRNSPQWRILNSEGTWTDGNGFRRKNNDYMVAMGSYYTRTLGDRFRITTENGNVFTVTICDFKADQHTNSTHQYGASNYCIIEFYVGNNLSSKVRQSGSASSIPELSGKITKIEKI